MRVAVRTALTIMQWVFGVCLYFPLAHFGSDNSVRGNLIFCGLGLVFSTYWSWLLWKPRKVSQLVTIGRAFH